MYYVDSFLRSPAFGLETINYNFNERYAVMNESTEKYRNYRNGIKVAGYLPIIGVISGLAEVAWGLYGVLQYTTSPAVSAKKSTASINSPGLSSNSGANSSQRRLDKAKIAVIHTARGIVAIAGYGFLLGAVDACVTVARPYFCKEWKAATV